MSGYVLLDRFSPVLVLRRTGPVDVEAASHLRDSVNRHLRASSVPVSVVYDVVPGARGAPDAAVRKVLGEWMNAEDALLRRRCASVEFAFPSAVSRGVLTAILWMGDPPMPTGVHGTARAAVEAALRRAERPTAAAGEILRAADALVRQSSATG